MLGNIERSLMVMSQMSLSLTIGNYCHDRELTQCMNMTANISKMYILPDSMKPTALTLWDQFGTKEGNAMSKLPGPFPTVIGVRLKINQYNGKYIVSEVTKIQPHVSNACFVTYTGLTLATKGSSSFIFNPAIPEANTLHNWY